MTLAWFQALGFLQISLSKFPLVPKYQPLGMLRKVWMLLVQGSWQLRHQDLWKGCCHSAYWLTWSICWHYWFKLFCITYSLPLTWFLWLKKTKTKPHKTATILPHWHLLLVSSSEGGVSCGWRGKQEGMGVSLSCPQPWAVMKLSFSPGPSCRGTFSIQVGALAPSWQQGTETLSFSFWSQAEVIEISSFMCCRGSRSVPYTVPQESCLTLCFLSLCE